MPPRAAGGPPRRRCRAGRGRAAPRRRGSRRPSGSRTFRRSPRPGGTAAGPPRAGGRCSSPSPRAGCAAAPGRRRPARCPPRRRAGARGPGRGVVGQAVLELVDELVRREHPQRGGGELDGERDAVEAAADRRREDRVRRRRLDLRSADRGHGRGTARRPGCAVSIVGIGLVVRRAPAGARPTRRARAGTPIAIRLVARIVRPGVRARRSVRAGAAARTCSTVSRTRTLGARPSASASALDEGPARLLGDAHRAGDRRQHAARRRSRRRAARTRRARPDAASPGGSARRRGGSCRRRRCRPA